MHAHTLFAESTRVLPPELRPMLAVPAEGPLEAAEYAYEVKWDGMRALVGVDRGQVTLCSRNGIDATSRFPELAAVREVLSLERAVLDAEIVRLVDGKPSFWALQPRIQACDPREIARLAEEQPTALIVFDLLRAGDQWLLDQTWAERRDRLEQLLGSSSRVLLSPSSPDGRSMWEAVRKLGLEGVVAKRRTSRYRPGKRSTDWLKIKLVETVDVVVGGWTEGAGARKGGLGALLVGMPWGDHGALEFAGHVGTGFDRAALEEARARLARLQTHESPFWPSPKPNGPVHWVRPELVCEVRHHGWTDEGRLRAPVFVGWRLDKDARECMPVEGRTQCSSGAAR